MTRAGEARAHAVLRHVFPDATVIEVIPNRSNMTDVIDSTSTEDTGWTEATAVAAPQTVSYPEVPSNPHNHLFTLSLVPDKAPFLVVRASSVPELLGTMDALESGGVYAAMGAAQAAFRAHAEQGRGPAPTAPAQQPQAPAQGYQAPPAQAFQGNQPPPFGPNVSVPGAPAYQGPPAQQQWAPPVAAAPQLPPGWYKLNVPFKPQGNNPGKPGFDAIVAQYQFRKGDPAGGGQVSFQKDVKSWFCAGDVAGAFGAFSPVPA